MDNDIIWIAQWRGRPMAARSEQEAWDMIAEQAAINADHWINTCRSPKDSDYWLSHETRRSSVVPVIIGEVVTS